MVGGLSIPYSMTNSSVCVVDTMTWLPAATLCPRRRSVASGNLESFLGRKGGHRCFVHRWPFPFWAKTVACNDSRFRRHLILRWAGRML